MARAFITDTTLRPPYSIVAVIACLVATVLLIWNPASCKGVSMEPTYPCPALHFHDDVQLNHLRRGDVISFRTRYSNALNKRVIGLPGEYLYISHGVVYVVPAGKEQLMLLQEPYLSSNTLTWHIPEYVQSHARQYQVPNDSVLVLGDNRNASGDSRSFQSDRVLPSPFIPSYAIDGRIIASLSRAGFALRNDDIGPKLLPIPQDLVQFCRQASPCLPDDAYSLPILPINAITPSHSLIYYQWLGLFVTLFTM